MKPTASRRRKVEVSLGDVLDAAISVANTEGLDALSIRSVATSLDLSPMSVYRFVESKDDLMDQLAVRVMDRAELPQLFVTDWRERVVALMSVWRELFISNPCVVQILTKRRITGQSEGLARLMEGVLANLAAGGLTGDRAVQAFWQIFTFTFGHVIFELPRTAETAAADRSAGKQLRQLAEKRGLRHVSKVADAITTARTRLPFEASLRSLLDGIETDPESHVKVLVTPPTEHRPADQATGE